MRDVREDELDLSQAEIAKRLGVAMRTYARWERGESYGYLKRLADIARALETTESELLGGEDPLTAYPTVEELASKMDAVLDELAQLRRDLAPRRRR